MDSGTVKTNGTELYYERSGSGPPIILIHGMALDRRVWDPQFASLSEVFDVVRYDARGYGKSALPTGEVYSHAEDLVGLIRHLELDKPVLIGNSMGGQIALEYCIRYPDAASALVLVSTMIQGWSFSDVGKTAFTSIRKSIEKAGVKGGKKALIETILFNYTMKNPSAAQLIKHIVADYSGYHFENDTPNKVLDPPMLAQLETIQIPVLAMAGKNEWPDGWEIVKLIGSKIAGSRIEIFDDAGHFANLDIPERFNRIVSDFVNEVTSKKKLTGSE